MKPIAGSAYSFCEEYFTINNAVFHVYEFNESF